MMERLVSFVCLFYIVTARPIVIGHRGAPGYRPEHTFDSYGLAIDYVWGRYNTIYISYRDFKTTTRVQIILRSIFNQQKTMS